MPSADSPNRIIAAEIAGLPARDLKTLRAEWRCRWGEPPAFSSRVLLARALAHRLQTEAFGDMPAATKRRLADLAERFMADRGFTPPAATALLPGSSLVREWQGKRHEVAVMADGFIYGGEQYRSLSKVAHRITGTKWNGPMFFRLKRKGRAA